jgi:hypothetical protein
MSDDPEPEPEDNIGRLLSHLARGSLAARLVEAYRRSGSDLRHNMKAVLEERLKKLNDHLAGIED